MYLNLSKLNVTLVDDVTYVMLTTLPDTVLDCWSLILFH